MSNIIPIHELSPFFRFHGCASKALWLIRAWRFCARIMPHGVESLNVAAASAVAFWQLGKL